MGAAISRGAIVLGLGLNLASCGGFVAVPGASSPYRAPSIAEQVSAEIEQLPDFATHRPRMLWRML